jgi:hypothetical protein
LELADETEISCEQTEELEQQGAPAALKKALQRRT